MQDRFLMITVAAALGRILHDLPSAFFSRRNVPAIELHWIHADVFKE
jgi:hypothetical protein